MSQERQSGPARNWTASKMSTADKPIVPSAKDKSAEPGPIQSRVNRRIGPRERVLGRWVITHREPSILVRGRDAFVILQAYGYKPRWSSIAKGWVLHERELADVACIAEMSVTSYVVRHEDGTDCVCGVSLRAEGRRLNVDPSDGEVNG